MFEVEKALRLKVAELGPAYDVTGAMVLVTFGVVVGNMNVAVLVAPGMLVPVGMLVILEVPVELRTAVAIAT